MERVQWPDACLGLDQERMCAQAITPGYRIMLRSGTESYEYRADLTGNAVRIKE